LRRSYISTINKQVSFLGLVLVLLAAGCSFEKKSGFNRAMQNLTAHYNTLYNANELLRQKQETYANTYIDDYGNILSLYQDTVAHTDAIDKELDAAKFKANSIINEKEQSHYVGDAYVVLGKANFLDGKYFDAVEFFSYVIRSYPKDFPLIQEAAAWKVRGLLYLNNIPEAKLTLDSAYAKTPPKKHITAEVYAATAQYDIGTKNYVDAELALKKAISYTKNNDEKLRWTFILGQLQELNNETTDAIASYTRIAKSNSSFEMAFNANLNRIRVEDMRDGIKRDRVTLLLSLLNNENNLDFNDQIYYQVAQIYAANKDLANALKYYQLSARSSLKNQNQKGLSYLRIADMDFNIKADYVNAKKYYDSTLTNLSVNYPGYQLIQKKSNNLQLLVDRLQIIAREDTLQQLAKLDEPTRLKVIDSMVNAHILQQKAIVTNNNNIAAANNPFNRGTAPLAVATTGSSFYFYNPAAVSQGSNDFKRKWGNRKLEDNWRRANKSAGTPANNPNNVNGVQSVANIADPDALPQDALVINKTNPTAGAYRQGLLQNVPLTPVMLAQSNTRVYNAQLDIANFYRDILDDKKEAINNYEQLLAKYPTDPNKAQIYYSLYRLYSDSDPAKSTAYKNRLLKEYPETIYAKVIIDPDYSKKLDDKDAQLTEAYNNVYSLYSQKKYAQVISSTDSLVKQYPNNKLLVQLYYLRAISSGHLQKVDPFRVELQQIVDTYPNDQLITPLVKEHLAYVTANTTELATQTYAIMSTDTAGALFTPPVEYQKDAVFNRNRTFADVQVIEKPVAKPIVQVPVVNKPIDTIAKAPELIVAKPAPKYVSPLFNERDSTKYYFVVNVSTGTTDLSSSRFGIGQFNRTNFQSGTIRHNLKSAGPDNQLIYVGRFYSLKTVKDYARAIIPIMPDIMKVSKDKYSFFIITQENLDKLAGKKLLDDYIEYYQQTLLK
jgi:outer membrane protein assembly factor BamD (BamD/ComL family)